MNQEAEPAAKPSKSERKREMLALQVLGEQLLELAPRELQRVALSEELLEAVQLANRLKSREGKRRQLQYIGKLMRDIDPEPLRLFLEQRRQGQRQLASEFHGLEKLRDELLTEGDQAIDRFMMNYPGTDRAHLRQLVRAARQERSGEGSGRCARKLFRHIKELTQNTATPR